MLYGFYANPHIAIVPYMMPLCQAKYGLLVLIL